jgi:N-acetylglutamate synthase-like GNAT family acetyltransferase
MMTKPGITFRLALPEDIPALSDLIATSERRLGVEHYTEQQIESLLKHQFIGVDSQLIADRTYYVAEAEGQIVGCGGWSRRRRIVGGDKGEFYGEGDDFRHPACDAALIRAFFVHPDWARRGIGRTLMEASEKAAEKAGFRRLELLATYTGVPLYLACGFRIVGPAEAVLPDGITVSGLRMTKTLE